MNLSIDTLIVACAIGGAGWLLKTVIHETGKAVISNMIRLGAKVESLEAKLDAAETKLDGVQKTKLDLNLYYQRLKIVEEKLGIKYDQQQ